MSNISASLINEQCQAYIWQTKTSKSHHKIKFNGRGSLTAHKNNQLETKTNVNKQSNNLMCTGNTGILGKQDMISSPFRCIDYNPANIC